MLTVALAKGRTTDDLLPLFRKAGISLPSDVQSGRSLVLTLDDTWLGSIRYLLAKPMDVPTYVSFGIADLGIVGKDVLLENGRDIYELLDLHLARCSLCVAGRGEDRNRPPERVATKYPSLAEAYFRGQGHSVEIVPLGGSVELASVIGLTDRIFDLVQTGATLDANGLEVFDTVYPISARLVANRSSFRLKRQPIHAVLSRLEAVIGQEEATS